MYAFRILIVNSVAMMRDIWTALFSSRSDFIVVGEFDRLSDFNVLLSLQPDVVLIELQNQTEDDMANIISNIKGICPWTLVIVFADLEESTNVLPIMVAGADGYLKNSILPVDLVGAIELTCRSGICFFPRTAIRKLSRKIV